MELSHIDPVRLQRMEASYDIAGGVGGCCDWSRVRRDEAARGGEKLGWFYSKMGKA